MAKLWYKKMALIGHSVNTPKTTSSKTQKVLQFSAKIIFKKTLLLPKARKDAVSTLDHQTRALCLFSK